MKYIIFAFIFLFSFSGCSKTTEKMNIQEEEIPENIHNSPDEITKKTEEKKLKEAITPVNTEQIDPVVTDKVIEGIDENKNGVWDEFEEEIALQCQGDEQKCKAFFQITKALQKGILVDEISKKEEKILEEVTIAFRCLEKQEIKTLRFLESAIGNTSHRKEALDRLDDVIDSSMMTLRKYKNPCDGPEKAIRIEFDDPDYDPSYKYNQDEGLPRNHKVLPPDPGEAGRLTLEGIDSDNDGVRDDVQIDIANRYPSNTNARLALRQLAKSLQKGFIAQKNNDTQALNEVAFDINSAAKCISASSNRANSDIRLVRNIMANTNERGLIMIDLSAASSGKFFVIEDNLESHCD